MVESNNSLDTVFLALSDSTRRSILTLVAEFELSIGEIATNFNLTFAAISKHIKVLESAGLVTKRRRGKEKVVTIVPSTLSIAQDHIERYACIWEERFNKLEKVLKEN